MNRKKYDYRIGERIFWQSGSQYGHLLGITGTITDLTPDGYPGCVEVRLDDETVGSGRNKRIQNGRTVHLDTYGECVPLREAIQQEIETFQKIADRRRQHLAELDDLGRPLDATA